MVSTRPSSRITTPLPMRSVPRMGAVNASSGTADRIITTASSAASRSNFQSSGRGRISAGKDHACSAMARLYDDRMVDVRVEDGVARIFLDRPRKANALSSPFLEELLAALKAQEKN